MSRLPAAARAFGPGLMLVPDNRFDLLSPWLADAPTPPVRVVIPYFEQPAQLERTLEALTRQTYPRELLDVVVADDGSAQPPPAGPPELRVKVVRQPDLGFRAGAARNLGAAAPGAEDSQVLVFLDADTVPEPGFIRLLTRWCALCPDALVVGRRRHADLSGPGSGAAAGPGWLRAWLGGDPAAAPPELTEPEWLRTGYRESQDLLLADDRSFRFVISAVLACGRRLFEDIGGFDERYTGYGGEDWDLAYRAHNAGAVLVHEPLAVGWHDGPEWAARAGVAGLAERAAATAAKRAETALLAALIPEPVTRSASPPTASGLPDVLVDLSPGWTASDLITTAGSLLAQTHRDLDVRCPAVSGLPGSGVRSEPWSFDQLRRARVRVVLHAPLVLETGALALLLRALAPGQHGRVEVQDAGQLVLTAWATRAAGRARRWSRLLPVDQIQLEGDLCTEMFGLLRLQLADGLGRRSGGSWPPCDQ